MKLLSLILLFTDNELYSGTVADFSGSDPIIYREPLQTEQYDSLSLNGKFPTSRLYFQRLFFFPTALLIIENVRAVCYEYCHASVWFLY